MKTNTLHFVANCFESIAIAIFLVLISAITTAKAQDNIHNVINGLFSPTAAQRFFETGRKDFAKEVDFLANPDRYLNGNILEINHELIEQMKKTHPFSDSWLDESQNQLYLDTD